jgi:dTDP-4-dehydrorhamnose 3,5-epimerase
MSSANDSPESTAERGRPIGRRDSQTVLANGRRAFAPNIAEVEITEIGNIITRSGWMAEVFRTDWPGHEITTRQVNYVVLNPHGVTDWHCHHVQNDRLIGVSGAIKLCLWDGRPASPSRDNIDIIRFGAVRPLLVKVPNGVWHALRNESGEAAAYLNVADQVYVHESPDNWRASAPDLPDIL